ncbi:MAG: energy transducer TonB [Zoogloeaceae bacterium]|jgi:protein TonB|nr:energy transducer TonB [Zoogloeaceae bacterium]
MKKQVISAISAVFVLLLVSIAAESRETSDLDEQRRKIEIEMRRLEAELDRDLQEYNQRPRYLFVSLADAKKKGLAEYFADFEHKITCSSRLHYPEAAHGKIYGDVVMTVFILSDGALEKVDIDKSSGQRILDEGAINIVQRAHPFSPLPPEIRQEADILAITATWTFTSADDKDKPPCEPR